MNDSNEIYEVVKEYQLKVDGFNETIKARIKKRINPHPSVIMIYWWEISHDCYPFDEAASVRNTGNVYAENFEVCEILLMKNLKTFTNIGVTPNKYY